jgi:hypothetical protein
MKPVSQNILSSLVLRGNCTDYEGLSSRGGRIRMTGPYETVSNELHRSRNKIRFVRGEHACQSQLYGQLYHLNY